MPELPEVETVCRYMAQALRGRRICAVRLWRKTLREPLPADFKKQLLGRTVTDVRRRAKYIVVEFADGAGGGDGDDGYWLIHLGMSGVINIAPSLQRNKHTHIGVELDNGCWLTYTDARRFGRMTFGRGAVETHSWLADAGPEPLAKNFGTAILQKQLHGKNAPIKTVLMDSRTVAGIGNIYASEILFEAGIAPQTAAGKINRVRVQRLARAIRAVLKRAIAAGGSSMRDFVSGDGAPGYFQTQWQVYGGAHCRRCAAALRRIKQSGRMTYYCPRCQK